MRRTDHDSAAATPSGKPHAAVRQRIRDGQPDFLRAVAEAVLHVQTATREMRGYGACTWRKTALHVEWLPGAVLLIFSDAEAVPGGRSLSALIELVRSHAQR